MELTVLTLSFTLLLILGVPVAFAIGLSSVATIRQSLASMAHKRVNIRGIQVHPGATRCAAPGS